MGMTDAYFYAIDEIKLLTNKVKSLQIGTMWIKNWKNSNFIFNRLDLSFWLLVYCFLEKIFI